MNKNLLHAALLASFYFFANCYALTKQAHTKGFVYLHEIDPTIIVSLRDYTIENFVGKRMNGYNKPICILTRKAAEALKQVQLDAKKNGYCLVIYDAYRPQQAVNHYLSWSKDLTDQSKKTSYYPRINKANLYKLGYISKRSSHSRGSSVDVTLIKKGKIPHPVKAEDRKLADGYVIKFLNDGTLDMGSHFDLFDKVSHVDSNLVTDKYKKRRLYLKKIMEKHGFKNYPKEWWHFRLDQEPHPANQETSYFDFPIE